MDIDDETLLNSSVLLHIITKHVFILLLLHELCENTCICER